MNDIFKFVNELQEMDKEELELIRQDFQLFCSKILEAYDGVQSATMKQEITKDYRTTTEATFEMIDTMLMQELAKR